jgi:hypothetical protein
MINENSSLNEQVGASVSKGTVSGDRFYPVGLVTIIKNVGKDNEEVIVDHKPNLLTTEGKAWVHDQLYQLCSGQTGAAAYIGLSNDGSHNPAAADTRTTWEAIEETSNGLERIACNSSNNSYNAGSSKSTIQYTFTCSSGAVSGIRLSALLNNTRASGTSKLVHEASFTAVDLQVNDTLQVTWEITLS